MGIDQVVIGCSAGGVQALQRLLPGLHPRLRAALTIVCHSGSRDLRALLQVLAAASPLPVIEAAERERPRTGCVQLAAPGYHLLVEPDGRFALNVDPKIHFVRPAIDPLLESAASAFGPRLAAVLLTGGNADGADGLAAVRRHGGLAIVQDPEEAESPTMPRAALARAGADHVCPLAGIPALLNEHCGHG